MNPYKSEWSTAVDATETMSLISNLPQKNSLIIH